MEEYSPLVPSSHTPATEVLLAGAKEEPLSDIFPLQIIGTPDVDGPLGNYRDGGIPEDSPLRQVYEGIMVYRADFYKQEREQGERTEQTRQGLAVTLLQSYLVQYIDSGYHNLLRDGMRPEPGIAKVSAYIIEKEHEVASLRRQQLTNLTVRLAELDRQDSNPDPKEIDGIPVIRRHDILVASGKVPPSEEVDREDARNFVRKQRTVVRFRLQRLKFERLSATAILRLLKPDTQEPTDPFNKPVCLASSRR